MDNEPFHPGTILIPATEKDIPTQAFYYCGLLECVIFEPNNCRLESIGNLAFSRTSISAISIPATVKDIGEEAFSNCTKLKYVYFSSENCQLERIQRGAFANTSIDTVVFPDTVYIEDGAFPANTRIVTTSTGVVVNENDVLCGRGSNFDFRPNENTKYREMLATEADNYNRASSKGIQHEIARKILNQMNRNGMRMLKKHDKMQYYYEVDDCTAISKIRQCLYHYPRESRAVRMEEQIEQKRRA